MRAKRVSRHCMVADDKERSFLDHTKINCNMNRFPRLPPVPSACWWSHAPPAGTSVPRISVFVPGRDDDPVAAGLSSVDVDGCDSPSSPSVWLSNVVPLSKTWQECLCLLEHPTCTDRQQQQRVISQTKTTSSASFSLSDSVMSGQLTCYATNNLPATTATTGTIPCHVMSSRLCISFHVISPRSYRGLPRHQSAPKSKKS